MKKLSAVLLFVCLATLMLAIRAPAVTLEQGWYANVSTVQVFGYDDEGRPVGRAGGYFYDTPPGQYGPFMVTNGPYHSYSERDVSVPAQVSAGSADSLTMIPSFGMTIGERIAWVEFAWETDYIAGQMRLELWRTRYSGAQELVWAQQLSNHHYSFATVLNDSEVEGPLFFKVAVIPEPSSFISVITGLAFFVSAWRIRRRSCVG